MRLGINLSAVSYFQSDLKFTDLMTASRWYDPPYNYWIPAKEGYCRTGTYTLTAAGKGTLQIADDVSTKTCVFNNDDAEYALICTNSFKRWLLRLKVNDATTPIADVKMYPVDMDPPALFHPKYLADTGSFDTLRTLHFYNIEASTEVNWSDANVTRWQQVIALANATGCNLWICLPHMATADYCSNLGALFQTLDLGIELNVEYSNEIWNFKPPFGVQSTWVLNRAIEDGITLREEYAKLANAAYTVFEAAWGRTAKWVYAGQCYNAATITQSINYAIAHGYRFDVIAFAPYALTTPDWTTILAEWNSGNQDGAIDLLFQATYTGLTTRVTPACAMWSAIAQANGIPLYCYEWAPNWIFGNDATKIAVGTAACYTEQMYTFIRDMYDVLTESCTLGNYYDHCTEWAIGSFWGSKNYVDEDTSPKWQALLSLIPPVVTPHSIDITPSPRASR